MFADSHRGEIGDFAVARHGGPAPVRRVFPNRMVSAFADEATAVPAEVVQKVAALHGAVALSFGTTDTRDAAESKR